MKGDGSRAAVLLDPVFLSSVVLLAVNDWIFKQAFHNSLTGKLSDFAGLFAVATLACNLAPRWRLASCIGVGVAFCLWKLPTSDAVFNVASQHTDLSLGRVVDPSDLIALTVLPLAFLHHPKPLWAANSISRGLLAAASFGVFVATSRVEHKVALASDYAYREYRTALAEQRLIAQLERCGWRPYVSALGNNSSRRTTVMFYVDLRGAVSLKSVRAYAVLEQGAQGTTLKVREVSVPGRRTHYADVAIRSAFSEALGRCVGGGV